MNANVLFSDNNTDDENESGAVYGSDGGCDVGLDNSTNTSDDEITETRGRKTADKIGMCWLL